MSFINNLSHRPIALFTHYIIGIVIFYPLYYIHYLLMALLAQLFVVNFLILFKSFAKLHYFQLSSSKLFCIEYIVDFLSSH